MSEAGDMNLIAPDMDYDPAALSHGLQIFVQIAEQDSGRRIIQKIMIAAQRLQYRVIFFPVCQGPHLFFSESLQECVPAEDGR